MQSIFKQWGLLLGIHQCSAADRYCTPPPWVVFQPNTKLTKVVVKFRCCSSVTLGKNLSLVNEDSGQSYWNKKQNQTYWVRELYFESQLKIQDVIIITVKKTQKNATTEKIPHIIFIKYIKIQNIYKESSHPEWAMQTTWKFPPNHKIQPGNHYCISCTAAITGRFVYSHKSIIFVMLVRRVVFSWNTYNTAICLHHV